MIIYSITAEPLYAHVQYIRCCCDGGLIETRRGSKIVAIMEHGKRRTKFNGKLYPLCPGGERVLVAMMKF